MRAPDFLFLDFDCVLHKAGQLPFEHLPELEAALAPFPALKIVVSSSWQEVHGSDEIVEFLGPLAGRYAGLTSDATPDDEFLQARQEAEAARQLPVFKQLQNWPIGRYLYPPGLRQREIELWMRQRAKPSQSWLAVDDDVWNFDEGCRRAVIVNLEWNSAAAEYEKLRFSIENPSITPPIVDPAFAWWRLVVAVPVSPVGDCDRLDKVKFADIPDLLHGDLDAMLRGRNFPGDGVWLTDWAEFLVRHLVDLRRSAQQHGDAGSSRISL